jgi:hypothetical protein
MRSGGGTDESRKSVGVSWREWTLWSNSKVNTMLFHKTETLGYWEHTELQIKFTNDKHTLASHMLNYVSLIEESNAPLSNQTNRYYFSRAPFSKIGFANLRPNCSLHTPHDLSASICNQKISASGTEFFIQSPTPLPSSRASYSFVSSFADPHRLVLSLVPHPQ